MFTYSHVNTPLSQSEHPYYLSLFIKYITSRWLKQRKQSILNNEPTAVTLTIVHETKKTNKLYYARNDPTILVTLVGTVVMFSALPMLVFASLHHRAWNSTLIGKEHIFLLKYGCCMGCLCLIIAQESLFEKVSIRLARLKKKFIASHYRPPSGHPLSLHLLGDSLRKLFSAASFPWLILEGDLIAVGLTSHATRRSSHKPKLAWSVQLRSMHALLGHHIPPKIFLPLSLSNRELPALSLITTLSLQ